MRVETSDQLEDDQVDAVLLLVDDVTETNGTRPLSDAAMLRLRHPGEGSQHLLLWQDSERDVLLGYAHLDSSRGSTAEVELVLLADSLSDDGARELLDDVRRTAGGPVQLWARGSRSAVRELAELAGFRSDRVLLQMRRPLGDGDPLDEPVWPEGVTVRTFVPGQDEAAWLEVNNRAFADHPDQSGWTLEDITVREAESWFDPAGFFLAERDGKLVGFHWTKVHPASRSEPPLGEVYVVGVDPSMQGQRLGVALTLQGLRHLQSAGLGTAMLYVDESNQVAVRLYERLGFAEHDRDVRLRGEPRSSQEA